MFSEHRNILTFSALLTFGLYYADASAWWAYIWIEPLLHSVQVMLFKTPSDTVAIRNPERHVRKASHCGSKQQWRSLDEVTLLLLVRAKCIYFCSSCTSRSWWITQSTQHHRRRCNNILSFLQRTTPIAHSFCEGWTRHDFHILVTAPFCCNRKSWAACAQSFALWQQATMEITWRSHSVIACSRHIYIVLFFTHIPFVVYHTINATPPERLQQYLLKIFSTLASGPFWGFSLQNNQIARGFAHA